MRSSCVRSLLPSIARSTPSVPPRLSMSATLPSSLTPAALAASSSTSASAFLPGPAGPSMGLCPSPSCLYSTNAPDVRLATNFSPAHRLRNFLSPTVWAHFTPLAAETKAVNLGQGFPGWAPPKFVLDAAVRAMHQINGDFMWHQYARSAGHLPLTKQIAAKYTKSLGLGRDIDPINEVVVTVGASEALCAAFMGLLNEGDEVVTLEPAFDIYIAQADMCGATLKPVPLRVNHNPAKPHESKWTLDMEELKKAFSDKTRILLLNTPQNPTGKVLTKAELSEIAEIVKQFPKCVVVADEVYEHMTYDVPHTSIASLPGMWERTLTISSAGKTFSLTGWKIGWTVGPPHLSRCIAVVHQWLTFSVATPLQQAIAESLEEAEKPYENFPSYYLWLNDFYRRKRDYMVESLRGVGLNPIVPEGGFFIVCSTENIGLPAPYDNYPAEGVTRDWSLCRWLTKEIGVAAIPPSSFYCEERKSLAGDLARFAVCKPDAVLEEATKRLQKVKKFIRNPPS